MADTLTIIVYGEHGPLNGPLEPNNIARYGNWLLAHELGHALGLDHDTPAAGCPGDSVMTAIVSAPRSHEPAITAEHCALVDLQNDDPIVTWPPSQDPFTPFYDDVCAVIFGCGGYPDPWWARQPCRTDFLYVQVCDPPDFTRCTVTRQVRFDCSTSGSALGYASDYFGPTVRLESPVPRSTVRGKTRIEGWAVDRDGVRAVEPWLDGKYFPFLGLQVGLPAVGCQEMGGASSHCSTSAGFSGILHFAGLQPGNHVLTLIAVDQAPDTPMATDVVLNVNVRACDAVAPQVVTTAPAAGAFVRGAVTLSAAVSAIGSVMAVEFQIDGVTVATDTEEPFAAIWNTLSMPDGRYSLQVRAEDGCGNARVSAPVSVNVNNSDSVGPQVGVSGPTDSAVLVGSITVDATATDPSGIARVEFFAGSTLVGTATAKPYSAQWDTGLVADGSHSLTARAFDRPGNESVSLPVAVTVANRTPVLRVNQKWDGVRTVKGSTFTFPVSPAGVSVLREWQFTNDGGALLNISSVYSTGTCFSVTVVPPSSIARGDSGVVQVKLLATAPGSCTGSLVVNSNDPDDSSFVVNLQATIAGDTVPPSAAISAPVGGALVRGVVSVTANATDNTGLIRVEFFVDGTLQGSDTTAPYSYQWTSSSWSNGPHSLQAKAWDLHGNQAASAVVSVVVDNFAPRVTIDIPAHLAVASGVYKLVGWATDVSRITSLQFKLDGVPLALVGTYTYGLSRVDVCNAYPGDPNCPGVGWSANFDSRAFGNGSHVLEVIATDTAGNTASMQRAFSILNAPQVRLYQASNGAALPKGGSLAFSATPAGVSDSRRLRIANEGNLDLHISSVTLTGSCFALVEHPATVVAPATSTYVRVQMYSSVAANCSGSLSLGSNDSDDSPYTIQISGAVVSPAIALVQDWDGAAIPKGQTVRYPDQIAQSVSRRKFRIVNGGGAVLSMSNPTTLLSGACFQLTQSPATPVSAGGVAYFEVAMSSATATTCSGRVTIQSNDPDDNPFVFDLSGRVTSALPVAPTLSVVQNWDGAPVAKGGTFTFPTQALGATVSRVFAIRNGGPGTLTISNPSALVTGACFSQIDTPPSASVASGASTYFRVRFQCGSPGVFSGSVTIRTNDPDDDPFSFTVTGRAQ